MKNYDFKSSQILTNVVIVKKSYFDTICLGINYSTTYFYEIFYYYIDIEINGKAFHKMSTSNCSNVCKG